MENITFTTPSGYIITLKPYLTFGDKRALERVFAEGMIVDPKNPTQAQASGKAVYDAQDRAVELLVLKIESPKGIVADQPGDVLHCIYSMNEDDGRMIYDKVNELTTPQEQKKGAKLPSNSSSSTV